MIDIKDLVKRAQAKAGTRDDLAFALDVSPHTIDSWTKTENTASHRSAPDWAVAMLRVIATGQPVTYVRGDVAITYQRAEDI